MMQVQASLLLASGALSGYKLSPFPVNEFVVNNSTRKLFSVSST